MIARITRVYTRHYSDNGQTTAYVEWIDTKGRSGRTEGAVGRCQCCGAKREKNLGAHMAALFASAERQGIEITHETW